MGNIPRSYVAGNYFLSLDGVECGFLRSAEGGDAVGEVVSAAAPGQFTDKRLGGVRYENIVLELGLGLAKPVYDWIDASWRLEPQRKSGSIAAAASDLTVRFERTFADGLISETTIPALDGASKEAAFVKVKVSPDRVTLQKGGDRLARRAAPKQKQFLACNFRLEIDGLDCTRVAKIDAFTVKQTATDPIGEHRDLLETTAVDFPNLRITLAEAVAATWSDWFEDFVVKGNNGPDRERSGSLFFLAPDLRTELGRVELSNLGIFALRRPAGGAGAKDQVARVVAELYCERMSLKISG
jgi:hypothetical protein